MYKRIRDGLIDPKRIIDYIADKAIFPILFLLIFSIVLTIPQFVNCVNFELSYSTKSEIISMFDGKATYFEIKNGELVAYQKNGVFVENDLFGIAIGDAQYENDGYSMNFLLEKEGVYFQFGAVKTKLFNYSDYEESKNLSLIGLGAGPSEKWDAIFRVVNSYVKDNPSMFIVVPTIIGVFSSLFSLLLVALIISLGALIRLRGVVKFGIIFKLNIYCLIPFVLGTLIDTLFGLNFIYIIGIIITFVYSYICQVEVLKKIFSHHTEG